MQAISKAEFARRQGLSRARITQYVKSGVLRDSLLPDGRLNLDIADREIRSNRDAGRRLDYELRTDEGRSNPDPDPEGPPPPFTGNIARDNLIMGLTVFYPYFLNIMAPIHLKLLVEMCHVAKESAEDLTILFGFKTHEIIKDFLEKDVFDQWVRKNEDITLDQLQAIFSRGPARKTFPPRDLPTMEHPAFILELLRKGKK